MRSTTAAASSSAKPKRSVSFKRENREIQHHHHAQQENKPNALNASADFSVHEVFLHHHKVADAVPEPVEPETPQVPELDTDDIRRALLELAEYKLDIDLAVKEIMLTPPPFMPKLEQPANPGADNPQQPLQRQQKLKRSQTHSTKDDLRRRSSQPTNTATRHQQPPQSQQGQHVYGPPPLDPSHRIGIPKELRNLPSTPIDLDTRAANRKIRKRPRQVTVLPMHDELTHKQLQELADRQQRSDHMLHQLQQKLRSQTEMQKKLQEEQMRQLVAAIDKQGSTLHTNLEEMAKLVGKSSAEMAQFLAQRQQRWLTPQAVTVVLAPSGDDDDSEDDDDAAGARGYKLVPVRQQPAPRYDEKPSEQERSMDDSQLVDSDDEERLQRLRGAGQSCDPPVEFQLYLPLDASHHHLQLAGVAPRSSHKAKDRDLQRFDPQSQQVASIAFVGQGTGAGSTQPSRPRAAWQAPAAASAVQPQQETRIARAPAVLDEGNEERAASQPFAPPDPFSASTSCRRDVMRAMLSKVARTEAPPRSPENEKQPTEQEEVAPPVEPAAEPAPRERSYLDEKLLALMQTLAEQQALAMEQHKILLEKTTAVTAAQPPPSPHIIVQAPPPPAAQEAPRRSPSNPLHDRSVQIDLQEFEWKQPPSSSDSSSSESSRARLTAQDVELTVAEAVAKAVTNVADCFSHVHEKLDNRLASMVQEQEDLRSHIDNRVEEALDKWSGALSDARAREEKLSAATRAARMAQLRAQAAIEAKAKAEIEADTKLRLGETDAILNKPLRYDLLTASDASLVEELRRLRIGREPRTDVGAATASEQSWAEESFETVFAAPTTVDHPASFSQGNWPLKGEQQHQSWSKQERERPSVQRHAFRPMLLTAPTGGPIVSTDVKALLEGDGACLPVPLLSKWAGEAGASAPTRTSMSFSSASNLQPLLSVAPAARQQAESAASAASSSDLEVSEKSREASWKAAIAQCRILRQVSWEEHFGGRRNSSSDSDSD